MIVLSDKYIWRIRIGFIAKVCIYIYTKLQFLQFTGKTEIDMQLKQGKNSRTKSYK